MTTQELDALQALCDGATKGPWVIVGAYNQFIDAAPDSDDPRTIIAEAWQRNAMMEPTAQGKADLAFIAAARTAMPALISEVRKLTAENAFLLKVYRENAALNRLMASVREIAENAAEGPYKDYYDRVASLPDCNDCGREACEYKPRWGYQVRINCPLWLGQRPAKEENQ